MADATTGIFEIKGKSLPEDAIQFYRPLEKYIEHYIKSPCQRTIFNLRLEYLNSSSAKKLVEIISQVEKLPRAGYEVELNWYYREEDQEMLEEGEEFARMTDLKVNLLLER